MRSGGPWRRSRAVARGRAPCRSRSESPSSHRPSARAPTRSAAPSPATGRWTEEGFRTPFPHQRAHNLKVSRPNRLSATRLSIEWFFRAGSAKALNERPLLTAARNQTIRSPTRLAASTSLWPCLALPLTPTGAEVLRSLVSECHTPPRPGFPLAEFL